MYLKNSLIIGSLLFLSSSCLSQSKSSIEIFTGPSMPLGKFDNKNYSQFNNSNGIARTGIVFGAKYQYYTDEHFGVSFETQYSLNKQDEKAIHDYLTKGAVGPVETKIQTGTWQILKLLAGINYNWGSHKQKVNYHIGAAAGASKTALPHYYWAVYANPQTIYNSYEQTKTPLRWLFSYQANAGVNYQLQQNKYLLLNLSYFNADYKTSSSNLTYNFSSLNLVVGIGFKF